MGLGHSERRKGGVGAWALKAEQATQSGLMRYGRVLAGARAGQNGAGRADGAPAGPRGGAGPRGRRRASWAAGEWAEAGKRREEVGRAREGGKRGCWAGSEVGPKREEKKFFK